MRRLTIGTRGSPLALAQTGAIMERLREIRPDWEIGAVEIKTTGDRFLETALPKFSGKGIFVKELETALLAGEADLAVHSLKDLPGELPMGLVLGAITQREDVRDVLVAPGGLTLDTLPEGAKVGTSSPRRVAQLALLRPDLRPEVIRGNLGTRLAKLARGECAALLLAAAGLHRLDLKAQISQYLSPEVMLPAPGQGALGLEVRADDAELLGVLEELNHPPTALACRSERSYLAALGGGCQVPLGAWARLEGEELHISGIVASPAGGRVCRGQERGPADGPEELGERLARNLLAEGAGEILKEAGR